MKNKIATEIALVLFLFLVSGNTMVAQVEPGQHVMILSKSTIWYHAIGEGDRTPLVLFHGGPGGTCYSLYPLSGLADERQVILFDQPGGGRSGTLQDTALMTMDYFVDQVHEFIEGLGLHKFYLYGHSWGTMLGIDYFMKYPEGIEALILNSPLVSTDLWEKDADTLISLLPDSIQVAIKVNEEKRTYRSEEYKAAKQLYYQNFIRRKKERIVTPYDVKREPGNNLVYNYMWGPSEFNPTGTLLNYDRLGFLPQISVPTLFITGEYDEARPVTVKYYSSLVPGSRYEEIPGAAHATMHDNSGANIAVIREFMHDLENGHSTKQKDQPAIAD